MAIVTNDWTGKITGSVFTTASSDAIKPPTGHVFVAITALTDTDFDSSGGLVADDATVWAKIYAGNSAFERLGGSQREL